jgi:hypothetical protein
MGFKFCCRIWLELSTLVQPFEDDRDEVCIAEIQSLLGKLDLNVTNDILY